MSEPFNIEKLAKEYVGDDYSLDELGTYTLIFSNPKFVGDTKTNFIVIKTSSGDIAYGPEDIRGKVSWYAEKEILIKELPEIIVDKNSGEDFSKIVNVESGQKRNINPNK